MSQENVEAVRRSVDAFNRGDRTTWLAFRDQDCEMVPIADWPDARAIRGREALWDFYLDVAQTLSFGRAYVEFVDAGADKVLGHQRHEARGQTSGADVEVDYWLVTTFRAGKIFRDEWFTDRTEALKAAALPEQPMSQENLDLFRRAAQAFNDGDLSAFLAFLDNDIVAAPRLAPIEGGYRGHAGIRVWWESMRGSFPDFHSEVVALRDLGGLTLAELHNRGRGAQSDTPVEQKSWHVTEWRARKIVRWSAYGSEAEALEAIRLRHRTPLEYD